MSQNPPTALGKYQIIREIARSNDIVYEAYDPVMNRRVAVKELAIPGGSTQSQREDRLKRFMREARAAGSLTHPNIVTIFEVGEDQGRTYIAMEFLDGRNLRSEIEKSGFLPRERAIEIAMDILSGLSFAHSKGVIHRDIKPDNIQLLENGAVKITDFGIARLTFEPNLTMDGQVFGTPSYMSPEQINGKELDPRSDLFSVGVILYEMLAGQKPFPGDSVVAITHAIMSKEPQMPGNVAYPLWEVIETSLNKMPQFRYSTAEDMRNGLKRAASSWSGAPQPTQTIPPPAVFGVPPVQPPMPPQPQYGQAYPGQVIIQPYNPAPPAGMPGQVVNQPYLPGGYGAPQHTNTPYQPYNPYGQPNQVYLPGQAPQVPAYYPPPPRRPLISPETATFLKRLLIFTVIALTLLALIFAGLQALISVASSVGQNQPRSSQAGVQRPAPAVDANSNAPPAAPDGTVQPPVSVPAPSQEAPPANPEDLFETGRTLAIQAANERVEEARTELWKLSQDSFLNSISAAGPERERYQSAAVTIYTSLAEELVNQNDLRRARQALQQAEGVAQGNESLVLAVRSLQEALGV